MRMKMFNKKSNETAETMEEIIDIEEVSRAMEETEALEEGAVPATEAILPETQTQAELSEQAPGTEVMTKPEKNKKDKKKKKLSKKKIAAAVAVILVAAFALKSFLTPAPLPMVTATAAAIDTIEESTDVDGSVSSEVEQIYFSRLTADVETLNVSNGDVVEAGDLLMSYSSSDLENVEKTAEYQSTLDNATYQAAATKNSENQSEYNRSSNDVEVLKQQVEDWKQKVKDEKEYVNYLNNEYAKASGAVTEAQSGTESQAPSPDATTATPEQNADDQAAAQEALAQAQEAMDSLNERIGRHTKKLDTYTDELAEFEANLAKEEGIQTSSKDAILNSSEQAQLSAQKNLSGVSTAEKKAIVAEVKDGIRADFSGVVSEVAVSVGGPAAEGTAMFKLSSNEDVRVSVDFSKYDLEKVAENDKATITIAGNEYEGTVTKISKTAEKNERGVAVIKGEIHIDNPDDRIYLGLDAKVKIHGKSAENTIVIPSEAVCIGSEGSFCYVVNSEGIVEKRDITTGLADETRTEVTEGLAEGDMVISGSDVVEGQQVAVAGEV